MKKDDTLLLAGPAVKALVAGRSDQEILEALNIAHELCRIESNRAAYKGASANDSTWQRYFADLSAQWVDAMEAMYLLMLDYKDLSDEIE